MRPSAEEKRSTTRVVMPPLFMTEAARMKKGTASSGKESMPVTVFWPRMKPGMPQIAMMISAETPSAMAIGTASRASTRKVTERTPSMIMMRSFRSMRRGPGIGP